MPDLILIGTSHRVAGVELRERLARGAAHAWSALARQADASISELFVLATCNRVECYAITEDLAAAERNLREYFGTCGTDLVNLERAGYRLAGDAAVEHLCRVACGLESMVIGEAEIAGQIRTAARAARAAGSTGPAIERVIAAALRASGRARSETKISVGVTSAASAAVTLAERELGALRGRTALVVGAGQAGRQALARLAKRRAGTLLISSRSTHHAAQAAGATGATIVAFDESVAALADADLLVTALHVDAPWLTPAACRDVVEARASRPLLIVDLSVPRAVDPLVDEFAGITLRTVDDLGPIVAESTVRRLREVPFAAAIAREEAQRVWREGRVCFPQKMRFRGQAS